MKFEATPRFDNDFRHLRPEHKRRFIDLMLQFSSSCDAYLDNPGSHPWPGAMRVKRMVNAGAVWEMTWSFRSPDGRATFEFVDIDGEVYLRWRRIGDHTIYAQP